MTDTKTKWEAIVDDFMTKHGITVDIKYTSFCGVDPTRRASGFDRQHLLAELVACPRDQRTYDYAVTVRGGGAKHQTKYHCGIGHTTYTGTQPDKAQVLYEKMRRPKPPSTQDVMVALLLDAECLIGCDREIDNFHREFGYESITKCITAYRAIEKTIQFLHRFVGDAEIIDLMDSIREAGY